MDLVPLRLAEHKAFLRLVHSAPGGGDQLYLGRALPGAIERYLKRWLPLVARVGGGELIPPLDIAWVWHLHRLAPRRYAAHCTDRFGRVLDPGAAAFQAQSAVSESDSETQRLWQEHFGDEPFFQRLSEDESSPAGWGPRDPLSNQTTLCAELKEACESVRSAHGFDYDVETCSARQRTFLWQISQPAFSEGCSDFSIAATARYLQFLGLMKKHGYDQHFFVPSYDIDFAWHTHMLASTSAYLSQTEALAAVPGGVDHDDSVNQRHEGSQLHLGWGETKELWALDYGGTAEPIEKSGVTYRGEPPDWWFKSDGADIFRVCDGFLTEDQVAAALEKLSCEANIRSRAHSGFDMVCQVSGGVWRRLREQLEAERTVAGQESQLAGQADLPAQAAAGQEEKQVEEQGPVEVPARVCPASKSVPQHKDKPDGKGAAVSSWITLVYLTHQPGSALVLVDDVTGCEYRVAIEPGRLVSWPNARFSHRVDVDDVVVAQDAVAAQGAELASFRCMLGPMAFTQAPGPSLSGKQIVYTEGGCGGGGCGGGGCGGGGGGCGGGGCAGGGGSHPINEFASRRILGTSMLTASVMQLEKGTANALALASTFVPAVYNATYRSWGSTTVVAYMQEASVSQALWQQLQQQIRQIEAHLAHIANLSDPPGSCDACCSGECGNPVHPNIAAFQAVAALIAATRDVHIARMNMELQGAARGVVSLHFGGSNSAYYLEPNGGVVMRHDIDLQAAQAAESAARAAFAQHNITLPSNLVNGPQTMIAPEPQTMIAPGTQIMMVQVPVGLSGGQSLQVQTPAGLMAVQIPPGLIAGQSFQMQVPAQPTQPAQPVMVQPVRLTQVAPMPVAPMPPTAEQMQRAP
jgi:hypothetical protein